MSTMFLPGDLRLWSDDPLDRGLIGHWEMDRNTGLVLPDYSYYANHATIVGADWIVGRYGDGLHFITANSDYVDTGRTRIGNTGLFAAATEQFTVEMSCRVANNEEGYIVARAGAVAANRTFGVYFNRPFAIQQTPTVYFRGQTSDTNWQIDDSIIHLIHATWNGTAARLYYDGGNSFTPGVGAAAEETTQRIIFGARTNGGGFFLDGDIFGVRIWDRALTALEVRYRYERWQARVSGADYVWMIPFLASIPTVARIPRPPAAYNTLAIY